MSFLTLTDVSKFYGPNCVVANMNLSVEKGEFVTLLGPSGCGKTTTLQMIAGFTEVSQGSITLDGRDITSTPPNSRGLGIVFLGLEFRRKLLGGQFFQLFLDDGLGCNRLARGGFFRLDLGFRLRLGLCDEFLLDCRFLFG